MSKTIVEKLNLQKYQKTAVLHTPEGEASLAVLKEADHELKDVQYDMIFAFVLDMKSLQELMKKVIDHSYLLEGGLLYVAYPKKGNKVYPTYIHRDELFDGLGADEDGYIGTSTIKFNRMVGMNEVFTVVGFKNEKKKAAKTSSKPSQCVDDYIDFVPKIEEDLRHAPKELAFYQSLTPGYQKDWARYVYSAVQEGTRAKRRAEMIAILAEGFKSIDLYRRSK
ncbi:YdeI/OmpD-associated family protein [Brevibacillus porteri]|uniref:YdeI/OmpD-associated family protein n=1 Tax=Brevibacillus porteri TaxID=2126350 RepID=UPI003628A3E3